MTRALSYLRGCCRVTLRGCEPERCLDRLLAGGVAFWQLERRDEFTFRLTVYASDASLVRELAARCQCEAELRPRRSLRRDCAGLHRRWALLAGLLLVLAGMMVLPHFVVRFEVEGCDARTAQELLRVLDSLGVGFGTWGPSVDNEQLRSAVLPRMPQLRWMAVNCSGMRATVLASPRSETPTPTPRRGAADLIADADGVVTQVQVLSGQAVCAPGQAVVRGQVLVSGRVDLERCTMTTRALGEVYALTRRQLTVRTLCTRRVLTPSRRSGLRIWLTVGRKRIKICGSSGISVGDCVKIRRRAALRLPGGIPVPLALTIERVYAASAEETTLDAASVRTLLSGYAAGALADALIAGEVLHAGQTMALRGGVCDLTYTAHCREMIARSAEIPPMEMIDFGTNDQRGTDGAAH